MKILATILIGLLLFCNAVSAAPTQDKAVDEEFVFLDFDKVDIRLVIKFVSELTGKNFIIDDKVSGVVTIVCPTRVSVSEVYKVFESILEIKGFAAVPSGKVIKIVPIREAQQKNIEVRVGKEISGLKEEDGIITQIIPLDYIEATEAVNLINPLKSPNTNMIVCRSSNSLIVTDSLRNVRRLLKIIGEIDNESQKNMVKIIPLKFIMAKKLKEELEPLIKSKVKPGGKVTILTDNRANSLVVVANKENVELLSDLAAKFDKEVPVGQSEIHIYYVKNSNAQDLAGILSKIFTQSKGRVGKDIPAGDKTPVIVADKNTNSLIITASPADYASLKKIIDKLDVRTKQVLVEALIAEVTLDATRQLGIEWAEDFGDYRNKSAFGGTNYGMRVESLQGSLYGLGVGLLEGSDIPLIIHAYRANTDVNILSTPHILTNDNQEAEISIGEVVPVLKDSRVSEAETVIKTFEYKDVGIKLRITPHINPEGYVRLEIYQEIQKLLETTLFDTPLMTKREAKTVVTVKDGKTVVIGGLIRDDKTEIIRKTPILADIPLLGWFFKRKSWTIEKTNLLIFITPHVIVSDEDLEKVSELKTSEMEEKSKDTTYLSASEDL